MTEENEIALPKGIKGTLRASFFFFFFMTQAKKEMQIIVGSEINGDQDS